MLSALTAVDILQVTAVGMVFLCLIYYIMDKR